MSHKFCAPSNWTRARTTDPFLGRLVRQGQLDPRIDQALILMGDWCGSSIRYFSTETPELPNHRADRTSAAKRMGHAWGRWRIVPKRRTDRVGSIARRAQTTSGPRGIDSTSCPNDGGTAWDLYSQTNQPFHDRALALPLP